MGKLLLFDIDGTLIQSRGAGGRTLFRSFLDAYASELPANPRLPEIRLAGTTDYGVLAELLRHFDLFPCEEKSSRFFDLYVSRLGQAIQEADAQREGILPGIASLLPGLQEDGRHSLAILTGNIQPAAWKKLEYYRLRDYFKVGAFGDDHADRNQLCPVAVQREAQRSGKVFSPAEVVVLGDTPRDIACGKAHGAHTIAVATGYHSVEELAEHDPSAVFENFGNVEELRQLIDALPS